MAPKSNVAQKTAKRNSIAPGSNKKMLKRPDSVQKTTPRAITAKKEMLKLAVEPDGQTTVDVFHERSLASAKAIKAPKGSCFTHTLRLQAADPFALYKTIVIEDGPYKNCQAILVQTSCQFPFMKLPEEARIMVYRHYFQPSDEGIVIEARRRCNQEVYAKKYAAGSKNRAALLAVNKAVSQVAVQVLYEQSIKFETTQYLLEFLSQVQPSVKCRLRHIKIKQYQKNNARTALNLLVEAERIESVTIESGIASDGDVKRAAKTFHMDTFKFLEAMADRHGKKEADLNGVFKLGKLALAIKDGGKLFQWSPDKVREFEVAVIAKMK